MWGLRVSLFLFLAGMCGVLRLSHYRIRLLFGILAALCAGTLGALLAQNRIREVLYDWPLESCFYQGTLLEPPQERPRTFRCRLRVDYRFIPSSSDEVSMSELMSMPVHREVWAYVRKDSLSDDLQMGSRLLFYAQIERPSPSGIPGDFDYAAYLFHKGVSGTAVVFPDAWQLLKTGEAWSVQQRALQLRQKVLQAYRSWGFVGDEGAVLSALTVGYKDELAPEVQTIYRQAGVSHVLALSGMHVAILWGLLAVLFRPLMAVRWGRWIKCLLIVVLLWAFAFLVGLSASVVRAVVMCTWLLVAQAASSESSSLQSLSLAASSMLCYNPFYLFDVGFQLSFVAVFSILMIYPLIFYRWQVHSVGLRYVWGLVAVSLAAQLGTAPLVLYYFSHLPVYFLLANVWVAPLVCLLVYGTVALWATVPFHVLHAWIVEGMQALLKLLNAGLEVISTWPMAEWGGGSLSPVRVAILYGMLGFAWVGFVYRWRQIWLLVLVGFYLYGITAYWEARTDSASEGVYLYQGQVYALPEQAMWQSDSLYRFRGITICLVADDRWRNRKADPPLSVDYLYLCRGYRGTLSSLQRLFRVRKVMLDASLPSYRRRRYEVECRQLGWEFVALEAKGSYRIIP